MKKSQDKSMADRSKVSRTHPSMDAKKTSAHGTGVARGIGPMGVDMCQGEAPELEGYSHTPDAPGACRNAYGIGEGNGGPSIDMIGPSNPGEPL